MVGLKKHEGINTSHTLQYFVFLKNIKIQTVFYVLFDHSLSSKDNRLFNITLRMGPVFCAMCLNIKVLKFEVSVFRWPKICLFDPFLGFQAAHVSSKRCSNNMTQYAYLHCRSPWVIPRCVSCVLVSRVQALYLTWPVNASDMF